MRGGGLLSQIQALFLGEINLIKPNQLLESNEIQNSSKFCKTVRLVDMKILRLFRGLWTGHILHNTDFDFF